MHMYGVYPDLLLTNRWCHGGRYEALLEAVRLALPRCRVFVVTPLNMGDVAAPAGVRHHLTLLQKLLPASIVAFKAKNMQVLVITRQRELFTTSFFVMW